MNPTSLSSLLLSKTLNIDPVLFDPVVRELQRKGSLGQVIRTAAIDKITPDAIKKIQEGIKKWQGRKVAVKRRIIEARERGGQVNQKGYSTKLDDVFAQLGKRGSYDKNEEAILKALEATGNKDLIDQFWKVKEASPSERITPFTRQGKSFLSSLQQNKSFVRAFRGNTGRAKPSRSFSLGSDEDYRDSFLGRDSKRSSRGSQSLGGNLFSGGSPKELLEVQNATYTLLKLNFKETNETLKKILTALNGGGLGGGSGSSIPDAAKAIGAGGIFAGLYAAAKKYAPKVVKGAAPAIAAYQTYGDIQQIDKAEKAGIYSKDEAADLRKKAYIQRGAAAIGGLGGGVLGTATTGGLGTVAGSYLGYELGDELGKSLGDSIYGKKDNRGASYLSAVAKLESGLDPSKRAVDSLSAAERQRLINSKKKLPTASGLYQFTDGTWNGLNQKFGKNYSLDDKLDPKKATEMMKLLSNDNQLLLEKSLGRSITDSELYTAHFMGMPQGKELLKADANLMANELFPDAAASNKAVFYKDKGRGAAKTVGELRGDIASKYAKAAYSVGAVPDVTLPKVPELAGAQLLPGPSNQMPISDSDMQTFAKQKVAQQNATASSNAQVAAAISQLSKESAVARNPRLNADGSIRSQPSISVNNNNSNQTAFSDINTIHIMDGLLLNVLTD